MPDNQWEDDDDMYDGEEETDMGDEPPKSALAPLSPSPSSPVNNAPRVHSHNHGSKPKGEGKGKRTVRVRPMHPSMIQKWPDIASCLLTFSNGKQVMFVKGG